jgi:tryptophan-rich sensory protein
MESMSTSSRSLSQIIQEEFLAQRWIIYYIMLVFIYLLTVYFSSLGINTKWYQTLNRPPWEPGLAVITVVALIVYFLGFYGLFLAFQAIYDNPQENQEIYSFFMIVITLVTGILGIWTYLFYIARQIGTATIFLIIGFVLYLTLVLVIIQVDLWAGIFNILYLLWLGYFVIFSVWIYLNNPESLRGESIIF